MSPMSGSCVNMKAGQFASFQTLLLFALLYLRSVAFEHRKIKCARMFVNFMITA